MTAFRELSTRNRGTPIATRSAISKPWHTLAFLVLALTSVAGAGCIAPDHVAKDTGDASSPDVSNAPKDAGNDSGPDAASCPRETAVFYDGDTFTGGTRLALATVCSGQTSWATCPPDLASALAKVRAPCYGVSLTTGCGVDSVLSNAGTHGSIAFFDSNTKKLIGYGYWDDVPFTLRGCRDATFFGGQVRPACADAMAHDLCSTEVADGGTGDAGP